MNLEKRIMYVCEYCYENAPEVCGKFDNDEIRITYDGIWLCAECVEHGDWTEKWETMDPVPVYTPLSNTHKEAAE